MVIGYVRLDKYSREEQLSEKLENIEKKTQTLLNLNKKVALAFKKLS